MRRVYGRDVPGDCRANGQCRRAPCPRTKVSAVRILLWHGYLLTGSGSNVYTANIARAWRDAGHDVLVLCQDPQAATHPFVDAAADFASDNRSVDLRPTGAE